MDIFLPVAKMSVDLISTLSLGCIMGFMSGLYGIGGGIISTPLLILFGIPVNVAVGTSSLQVLGSGFSNTLRNIRIGNVDFRTGTIMFFGGWAGSTIGIYILNYTKKLGFESLIVVSCYSIVMMTIVLITFISVIYNLISKKNHNNNLPIEVESDSKSDDLSNYNFLHLENKKAKKGKNIFIVLIIGFVIGVLSAIMGIGGSIVGVPAGIIFLGFTMQVSSATALYQSVLVAINISILQAINGNVDIFLAIIILISSAFATQIGARIALKINQEILKTFMALTILYLLITFLIKLFVTPINLFSIQ